MAFVVLPFQHKSPQPKTQDMAKILTQDTVVEYVKQHADDIKVFSPDATLTADAIQVCCCFIDMVCIVYIMLSSY